MKAIQDEDEVDWIRGDSSNLWIGLIAHDWEDAWRETPLGYWGERMGDVLFAYAPGFVWGTNERGDTVAELVTPGANHGPQVPTASTAFASNHGVAFFHGVGIRGGVELPFDTARGIQRMDSAGATFARLLGLPTDSLDGKPLTALLDPA